MLSHSCLECCTQHHSLLSTTHPATQAPPQHRNIHAQRNTLLGLATHTDTDAAAQSDTHSSCLHRDTITLSTRRHPILSHTAIHIASHQSLPHSSTSYKKPPATAEGTGRVAQEATAVDPGLPCPRPQSLCLGLRSQPDPSFWLSQDRD